jgi:hypothetical protein
MPGDTYHAKHGYNSRGPEACLLVELAGGRRDEVGLRWLGAAAGDLPDIRQGLLRRPLNEKDAQFRTIMQDRDADAGPIVFSDKPLRDGNGL